MPFIGRLHRLYLPLMPFAIEQIDLRNYDIVISSSYAVATGVLTGPDQLHISYVHSPMRYAWDLQHQYLEQANLRRGVKSLLARWQLHRLRMWDVRTGNGVDHYMTNSEFVARRIQKIYNRNSVVIYPPVDVPAVLREVPKDRFFLAASRLVPYKNMRAIVEAFRMLPEERLVVVGEGPEFDRIRQISGGNVELLGFVDDDTLRHLMATARALIFAAEEDFGIVPVEAQGCGTPVIALGRGGVRETVITTGPARTGLFFALPTANGVAAAVRRFICEEHTFSPRDCHKNALRFSVARFHAEFSEHTATFWRAFDEKCRLTYATAQDTRQQAPEIYPPEGVWAEGEEVGP
jgi:glycosyltransferase involved in cell wall biosynthesis